MDRHGQHFKVAPKEQRLGPRGITYRSKMERQFAEYIELVRTTSDYVDWEYEPSVSLAGIVYKPDFVQLCGQLVQCYHEIKSFRRVRSPITGKISYRPVDKRWPTIKKLWKLHGPAELKVWTLQRKAFKLVDTIKPEKYLYAKPERRSKRS